jgi:hypothetical protein
MSRDYWYEIATRLITVRTDGDVRTLGWSAAEELPPESPRGGGRRI